MRKPLLFVFFLALTICCLADPGDISIKAGSLPSLPTAWAAIEDHPSFKEMKARAEKAETAAEYWKAIAERNELAIRLLQSEAQLAEARRKIESLEKKNP